MSKFRFRGRCISGLGEGRVTYNVDFTGNFSYIGRIEGKPGEWRDAVLALNMDNAPCYKTREEAAQAICDNFYGPGKGI